MPRTYELGDRDRLFDAGDLAAAGVGSEEAAALVRPFVGVTIAVLHERATMRFLAAGRRVFALHRAGANGTAELRRAIRTAEAWAIALDVLDDLRDGVIR